MKHVNPEGARKGKIDWKKLRVILDDLADFAFEDEITRFVFDFDVDFSIPPNEVKEILEEVCKKYEPVFEYLPQFRLIDMDFRAEFEMVVFCFSPFIIIHNYDAFLNDIATALYSKKEGKLVVDFGDWLESVWDVWDIPSLGWKIPTFGLFLYLCIQIAIIALYFVIKLLIRKREIKFHKISPDLFNGLRFLIRIGITIISVIALVVFLNVDPESVLLIMGIFTTAILFASMKTINNFIAGVWITFSQPFTVGDYVKIKNVEGIVAEISMNYTKIRHKTNNITQIPKY